ncbi:AAA domain-containing protein [Klebsiella aerogenes]|uniref:AAA domain-containing protein n=1 Tax=Dryocola boscaweniae TaxID=2925397 RepID=UPI0022F0183A|nr:AAA domain-containing protein [Dryocola boscaweniae]MCT4714500.1 AAA domain-containing protein [Dryocola boscaweniae]
MQDQHSFLANFTIANELSSASKLPGKPTIYNAYYSSTGSEALIKKWSRDTGLNDSELYLIWLHEVRQLQRLQTYPGAQNYLLPMSEAGVDSSGYYLVFNSQERIPYPCHDKETSNGRLILRRRNSLLFWSNIKRLAKGLGVLHSQGLLHRNLDEWSIFTTNGNEPDYQLGGFEWSLRLGISGVRENSREESIEKESAFSFREDWKDLGILISKMLNIDIVYLTREKENAESKISVEESSLLKNLMYPSPVHRIDCDSVCKSIDEIIKALSSDAKNSSKSLYLCYDHTKNINSLVHAMRQVDPKLIERYDISDPASLIDFITADLSYYEFVELKHSDKKNYRYALNGRYLTYSLNEYKNSWSVGGISEVKKSPFPNKLVKKREQIENLRVLIKTPLEIASKRIAINDDSLSWDDIFDKSQEGISLSEDASRSFNAFLCLHVIELLQQAANTWLVEIVSENEHDKDGNISYVVKCIADHPREKLSRALCIDQPIDRFEELLEEKLEDDEIELKASEKGTLGTKHQSFNWSYLGQDSHLNDIKHFKFKGKKHFNEGELVYLRLAGDVGYDELMHRRTFLLARIKENPSLLESLIDPLLYCNRSHENIPDYPPSNLDESKQKSFHEILNVLPSYYLQGPPGVGKTHLVTELVKQRFNNEPSSRILISAQGHDAVNNLMEKICNEISELQKESGILIVRSNSHRLTNDANTPSLKIQSKKILRNLMESNIFKIAPAGMRSNIEETYNKINSSNDDDSFPEKSLESLLLRSANLVFSTTNSSDLEKLISSSSDFDWSIVEEAGRATGTELIAPMILSHRRLLIGDPQQLPPFGEDKILALLKDPSKLKQAFEQAEGLLDRSLNELGFDDILDSLDDSSACIKLAKDISHFLLLFKSLHDETFEKTGSLPVSGRLSFQHRMHPAISDLVSHVFYEDTLRSDQKCIERFENTDETLSITDSGLPHHPIVIIDMPHSQRTEGSFAQEKTPYYHNPAEVDEVIILLEKLKYLKSSSKKLSLVVLTPYKQQIVSIKRAIALEKNARLSHLDSFEMFDDSVQTIDSFQGKEADIVIASLVRNNSRSYKKGLGIVGDSRRMNVLISRAKHKLFIITSLEFLNARFLPGKTVHPNDDLFFLKKLLEFIEDNKSGEGATIAIVDCNKKEVF